MAKKSHSGGPGSYTQNGVNCTMDAPFKAGLRAGDSNKMGAPFDGGTNGIPTRVYDNLGGRATGKPPGQVGPSQQGGKREGTKEYPMGGGSMRDGKSSGRP